MPYHTVLAIHLDDPVVELVCNQDIAWLVEARIVLRPCGRRGGRHERGQQRRGAHGCPTGDGDSNTHRLSSLALVGLGTSRQVLRRPPKERLRKVKNSHPAERQ